MADECALRCPPERPVTEEVVEVTGVAHVTEAVTEGVHDTETVMEAVVAAEEGQGTYL